MINHNFLLYCAVALSFLVVGCAEVTVPDSRNVNIPTPVNAEKRKDAVNEHPDSVLYLPLGEDVLIPERISGESLPQDKVGPFELRGETLAGALQLILADYDISIAFESEEGLTRKVTVANLKGTLEKVVSRVCSLANLYCSYEDQTLVIKDTQKFAVTLPPLATAEGGQEFIGDVIQGLTAVIGDNGSAPASDPTTRTIIYSATQRTAGLAENYFQRLRAHTAMIIFETYIWEVSLDSNNTTGINWETIEEFGKFNASLNVNGVVSEAANTFSIGLPTTQAIGANPSDIVQFLSQFGAVKTISQPQITVLSGSSAQLRVADTQNFVSEVTSTINGDQTAVSVSTDSVDTGFTISLDSSWDKSTVYSNVEINLTNVRAIEPFDFVSEGGDDEDGGGGASTTIQLPETSERELTTQIRVRPGDSVLIGGLVQEQDNFDSRGPGFMEPILPSARAALTTNLELVIMMRPRVVVYTSVEDRDRMAKAKERKIYKRAAIEKKTIQNPPQKAAAVSPAIQLSAPPKLKPIETQPKQAAVAPKVVQEPVTPAPVYTAPKPVAPIVKREEFIEITPEDVMKGFKDPYRTPLPRRSYTASSYNPSVYAPDISPQAGNEAVAKPDIYKNAKPLNVYDAYQRSQDSFYAP